MQLKIAFDKMSITDSAIKENAQSIYYRGQREAILKEPFLSFCSLHLACERCNAAFSVKEASKYQSITQKTHLRNFSIIKTSLNCELFDLKKLVDAYGVSVTTEELKEVNPNSCGSNHEDYVYNCVAFYVVCKNKRSRINKSEFMQSMNIQESEFNSAKKKLVPRKIKEPAESEVVLSFSVFNGTYSLKDYK